MNETLGNLGPAADAHSINIGNGKHVHFMRAHVVAWARKGGIVLAKKYHPSI